MDEINGELDAGEEGDKQKGKKDDADEDVDIYEDLETNEKGSDANCNVIERFNRLFSPKKRMFEDDFEVENAEEEEDVGLYDDLNSFENHLAAEELEAKVETLEQRCSTLDKQNAELKTELEKVNKINLMLRRNISSVFKTAKAELDRKERQLKDLQREHDALIFRRGGGKAKTQPTNNSQIPANIPGCQVLKKDSTKGNLITIEKETDCTFQMGNVTLSFVTESLDFQAKRFQRLEVAAQERKTVNPKLKNVEESVNNKAPGLAPQQQNSRQTLPSSQNLEDGEVSEEEPNKAEGACEVEASHEGASRRKDDFNSRTSRRSRSSSRTRSPVSNKRKRSSSPGMDRHYLRNRPNERGPPLRARKPRTPVKSYGYRNTGNSHFNSRSNRR